MVNYKRGSFFNSPAQKRYRPPDQVDSARHALMMLKDEMEHADEDAVVSRETVCETFNEHEFEPSERYLHTMVCTKCNIMVEHPAKWYAENPPDIDHDLPPTDIYE